LPLATLAKSNEPEKLLRNVAQKIREIPEKSMQKQISGCTEILAGIRFTEPLIRSLFREEIMKESVIYQSIHRQAREEGLQEGLQQGLQDEALRLVLRQLTIVLGEIAPESKAQIEGLSQERLENLAEALLAFKSQKDLENWLLVLGS
jgi:predicted transposase YdaD